MPSRVKHEAWKTRRPRDPQHEKRTDMLPFMPFLMNKADNANLVNPLTRNTLLNCTDRAPLTARRKPSRPPRKTLRLSKKRNINQRYCQRRCNLQLRQEAAEQPWLAHLHRHWSSPDREG